MTGSILYAATLPDCLMYTWIEKVRTEKIKGGEREREKRRNGKKTDEGKRREREKE